MAMAPAPAPIAMAPTAAGEPWAIENALLGRLRSGDERAFRELVGREAPRLLAVARRLLRSEEDARDALQEGLVQAYRALPQFAGQSRLGTWMHRIVVNAALMRMRRQRSRPEEPLEELLPTFREDGHQVRPSEPWRPTADCAHARLERRELRQLVRDAIERLPDTYRTVLLLRDIEELDTHEVATLLDITDNAVKIRLHRARQALRALLDPHLRP